MQLDLLPVLLFLSSSAALEARARGTSGAKERLAGVPSRRKNNSQGRHNASAAAWLQSQRKRDASCSSPPLESANLWCSCDGKSGRRIGRWNDRPERLLRSQGPRSRHQIRRTPTNILAPTCGEKPEILKQNLGAVTAFQRLNGRLVFQDLEDETYVLVLG